jgi:hypothetical protein
MLANKKSEGKTAIGNYIFDQEGSRKDLVEMVVLTITVDNCSVNDGVVDTLTHKLNSNQLLLGGSVLHMRCCAHILNLIIKDELDIIGQSLEKIRNSCVFWSSTPKKMKILKKQHDNCASVVPKIFVMVLKYDGIIPIIC